MEPRTKDQFSLERQTVAYTIEAISPPGSFVNLPIAYIKLSIGVGSNAQSMLVECNTWKNVLSTSQSACLCVRVALVHVSKVLCCNYGIMHGLKQDTVGWWLACQVLALDGMCLTICTDYSINYS